jgi:DNA-nicking Smr family endonuclease
MIKKIVVTEADQALFREAMRGVSPLPKTKQKVTYTPPVVNNISKKKLIETDNTPASSFSDHEYLPPLSSEDLIEYNRTGISHKTLRKLRAGQYNVDAILDLHGMTVDEARESLHQFLLRCQQKSAHLVLIIHGKGRNSSNPILKNKLNHWLRQIEQVLAFCSASAKDGRSGAMYVLLKNSKGRSLLAE